MNREPRRAPGSRPLGARSRRRWLRAGLAVVISPFACIPVVGVIFFALRAIGGHPLDGAALDEVRIVSIFAVPIAAIVLIVVGLPVSFLLGRRGRLKLRHFAIAGALVGAAPFAIGEIYETVSRAASFPDAGILRTIQELFLTLPDSLLFPVLGAACGAACAVTYRAIRLDLGLTDAARSGVSEASDAPMSQPGAPGT